MALSQTLSPPRSMDKEIEITTNFEPGRVPHRLSRRETELLRVIVEELLSQGFFRRSASPWPGTVFFSPKKDGKLRFCIHYRVFNKQTIRNFFRIPRTEDCIDKTQGSKIFSIIDSWSAYHQILVSEPDFSQTAFSTPSDHLEYVVVPFRLTIVSATFESLINSLLGLSWEQRTPCQTLKVFLQNTRNTWPNGVTPFPSKLEAITSWPNPNNVKALQSFLGFVNY